MPLNRKWRSMDFFGSHESLNKAVSNQDKNNRPLSIHEKTDHQSRFPLKISFRSRLTSGGSREQLSASTGCPNEEPANGSASALVQKCIIIQRDGKGYGFTVSGDNPVYVASVKQDGAAARAGVHNGDKIIKVNGTLVTQRNHLDVVKLIKSGSFVALTLLGKSAAASPASGSPLTSPSSLVSSRDSLPGLVTAPHPADPASSTSDVCSMSDSPHTSPSVSPTLTDSSTGHNGLDMTESSISATDIIHIDDEEVNSGDDEASGPGPFVDIKLLEHKPAHMAVFLNYLISNSDPSHVLFYIISDLYQRSNASIKELRKWAYEIFSTFIHKLAPLSISVEDNVINHIDSILVSSCHKADNENLLRSLFLAPRQSRHPEIADSLSDFIRNKNIGMASIYGIQRVHMNMDRLLEIQVVEDLLMPHVRYFSAERNTRNMVTDRDLSIGWALATFIRSLAGPKSAHHAQLDTVHTFMMRDKRSIKFPGSRSNRAKAVRGHQFTLQHLYVTTFCSFCGKFIWGVGYQAYHCQSCDMILHKPCADQVTEHCGGKLKKRYSTAPTPARVAAASHRRPGSISSEQMSHAGTPTRKSEPKVTPIAAPTSSKTTQPYLRHDSLDIGSTLSIIAGLTGGHAVKSVMGRYQGVTSPTVPASLSDQQQVQDSLFSSSGSDSTDRRESTDIVRSGSLNNKDQLVNKPARRTNSDNNLDSDTYKAMDQSGSSSTSSISIRSLESPGHSTDNVTDPLRALQEDPDLDVESELPPLKQLLPEEILRKLKPKEKKRQEVINELFYTERAHLRNLKVLDLLFYRPMKQEKGTMSDLAKALFPNMEEMISLHVTFVSAIRDRQRSAPVVKDVADLLLQQFDGECGNRFRDCCAAYCRNQVFALDALKKHTRKEPRLQQFLQEAECSSLCRRLQLKDLVPSQIQRLTKYPLLIDSLLKYTQSSSDEYRRLEKAHEKCKHILAYVNTAVRECENYHKLKDIQRRLDTRPVDSLNDQALAYLKNLDITQQKLVFDGALTWKLRAHRTLDTYVLLFEEMLVILQTLDGRFILKCQNTNAQQTREDKYTHYPVLKLQNLLARTLATDKNSFFVVNMLESRAQMYEFTAASPELRSKWCKLINDKADDLKKACKQASQTGFMGIDRNRPSRISRKGRHTGEAVPVHHDTDPVQQDMLADKLAHSLQASEHSGSDTDLILPEEVSIFDAVTSQSQTFICPEAVPAWSVGDTCSTWPPVSGPPPVQHLQLISTARTGSTGCDETGHVPESPTTHSSSPHELVHPAGLTSDGMSASSAELDDADVTQTGATLLQQQEEDSLREKYGLAGPSCPVSELVHTGVQESTVLLLQESVQPLAASSSPPHSVLATESLPVEGTVDGDDDDVDNVISVADLPLPDVTSHMMSHHDSLDINNDVESDDLDTLTFKSNYQDFCSLTTTLEDVDGEEREVDLHSDTLMPVDVTPAASSPSCPEPPPEVDGNQSGDM
ncbi:hypothetical protein BsWGS_17067 [Bradybaena similaris]